MIFFKKNQIINFQVYNFYLPDYLSIYLAPSISVAKL